MLRLCLFLVVVIISFPVKAMAETCSFFAQQVQTSFDEYTQAKKATNKRKGSSVSFNIVGIENHALQNLNNNIQIYRNLNCDVKNLQQNMDKILKGNKK